MIVKQSQGFYTTLPLWQGELLGVRQFDFPILNIEGFSPKAIPDNIRLGHQVEYIFKQLIEHSDAYQILLYNLPIRRDKETLGEIDFILFDKRSNRPIHIELTYKFYVIDSSFERPINQLVGPNRKDSFYHKITKIKEKQFPLLHSPEGTEALASLDIDYKAIVHYSCFKAQLFTPIKQPDVDLGLFNMDCIAGEWLRVKDLDSKAYENAQYYIPSKSAWLIAPHKSVLWLTYKELITYVSPHLERQHSPMLWIKLSDNRMVKVFLVWW